MLFAFTLQPAGTAKNGDPLYKIACSDCGSIHRTNPMRERVIRPKLAGYECILCEQCARARDYPGYIRCMDITFSGWSFLRKATPEDAAAIQRAQLLAMAARGELKETELGAFDPQSFYGGLLWGCEIGGLRARLEQLVCDTGFKTDIIFYHDHGDVFRVSPTADNKIKLYKAGRTHPLYSADFSSRGLHEVVTAARFIHEASTLK